MIANDGNDLENNDDEDTTNLHHHPNYEHQVYCESHYIDSSDENELDMISSKQATSSHTAQPTGRGLRKTVLNNVDRLLNSGNKQIKL